MVDTAEFRRLAQISQLGLVSLVYPAAIHTRFEHSLGVYRLALLFLRQLSYDERFAALISPADAELFIVAALLHDLGHWPFCHPIEDMRLPSVPAARAVCQQFSARRRNRRRPAPRLGHPAARRRGRCSRASRATPSSRLLASMLSGPDRHRQDGLPGPRQPARRRALRPQLRPGAIDRQPVPERGAATALAITEKGKTAAEMMVFARYVMFSEVYWHHGVRAATAMLQRAFYLLHGQLDLDALFRMTEGPLVAALVEAGGERPGRRAARRPVRPAPPALQAAGAVQLVRRAGDSRAAGPAALSVAGRLRRAVRARWPARRWGGSWRRTKSCSTRRRSSAKSTSTSTVHFSKDGPVPAAGRSLAGGARAWARSSTIT